MGETGKIRLWRGYLLQGVKLAGGALAAMLDLGRGRGPMNHMFALHGEFMD